MAPMKRPKRLTPPRLSPASPTRYNQRHALAFVISLTLGSMLLASLMWTLVQAKKCEKKDETEMESCAMKLETLTDEDFRFPKNVADVKDYCERLQDNHGCVANYVKDCLPTMNKLMAAPVLRNIKDSMEKRICKNFDSRKDFIKRVSCANDKNIVHFQRLVRASIARLEYLTGMTQTASVSVKDRSPYVCCSLRLFHADIKNTTAEHCEDSKSADSMSEFLIDLTQGAAGSLLDMFCSNYRELSDCEKPPQLAKYVKDLRNITDHIKDGSMEPQSKAMLPLVFKLV